jgi:hypothetical protein
MHSSPSSGVYNSNPSTQQEDREFAISLGYTVRSCLKEKEKRIKQHIPHYAYWKVLLRYSFPSFLISKYSLLVEILFWV